MSLHSLSSSFMKPHNTQVVNYLIKFPLKIDIIFLEYAIRFENIEKKSYVFKNKSLIHCSENPVLNFE